MRDRRGAGIVIGRLDCPIRPLCRNDTGPMHLAAASEVPVIEISCHPLSGGTEHPNSPDRFGPYATRNRVLRPVRPLPPCVDGCTLLNESHCIAQVLPSEVIDAALSLLDEWTRLKIPSAALRSGAEP
jgi:hypothetical protein